MSAGKKVRICTDRHIQHGFDGVQVWRDHRPGEVMDGYVRTSEWVEVEFPPRENHDEVAEQVAIWRKQREAIAQEYGRRLAEIDERIASLLAITHIEESQP